MSLKMISLTQKILDNNLVLISIILFSIMGIDNYNHPKRKIIVFILMSIFEIFFISFYQNQSNDKDFYKTVFIIIFIFGIVFSFLTPIFCNHDDVEHFVRAEMTSNGVIFSEYYETANCFEYFP